MTTFAIGTAAWKREPQSSCTVTEYRARYRPLKGDSYVNLKGYLYGGKDLSFGDEKLNGCAGSGAEVMLADESSLNPESRELIRELRSRTDITDTRGSDRENKYAIAEVEIIGLLSEREQYCFSSRYVITVVEIAPKGSVEVISSSALADEFEGLR